MNRIVAEPGSALRAVEWRLVHLLLGYARRAAFWGGAAGLLFIVGAALAGRTDAYLGAQMSLLFVGGCAGLALFAIFAFAQHHVLLAWPLLTGIAYPFVRLPAWNPVITFDRVWIAGMLACLMVGARGVRHAGPTKAFILTMTAFTIGYGIRAFASDAENAPVATWIEALVLPLVLFLVTAHFASKREHANRIAAALMCGGAVLAVLGILQAAAGLDLTGRSGGVARLEVGLDAVRISGPYSVPEPYALSLVICFAATLYWAQTRSGFPMFLGLGLASVEAVAIALTLFRAAWISALIVVVAAFGIRPRRAVRALMVVALTGMVLAAATTALQTNEGVSGRVENTDNIYGRIATYEQGLEIFTHYPLFGVGVNGYHFVARELPEEEYNGVESVTYAHSSFINVLAEQGVIGFVLFLGVCAAALQLIRSARARGSLEDSVLAAAAAGAAVGYLVFSLTLTMLPYGTSNAFLAMLLGIVAGRLDGAAAVPLAGAAAPATR